MKKIGFILLLCFFMVEINAQSVSVVKLWDGNPPTSNDLEGENKIEDGRVSNVTDPDITIYIPADSVKRDIAVVICPGGGYARLAFQHEGVQFAEWLNSIGITGIVLKYRMPNKHKEVPLDDLQQAIRYTRSKAKEWGIDKVGVAGFSAGGHLAATASTKLGYNTADDVKPDFSILFYPVITMTESTHQGSRTNLLGDTPSLVDRYAYSNETLVNAKTPPCILLLSDDDKTVPPINSIMYYEALKKNDIPATMYIFPTGGHGWGMREDFRYHDQMLGLLKSWLDTVK